MTDSPFTLHTPETAPEASRPMVEGAQKNFGFVPGPVAAMAESPELLGTFMKAVGTFDQTSLEMLEREVVVLTVATYVECHYCVAMHSATLTRQKAPAELLAALREKAPLADARLEAIRQFTLTVLTRHGQVGKEEFDAFFAAGYTRRNALEVVMGVGTYTMSTFANRMTAVELDPPFVPFAWEAPAE
ncbi:carboxymuconolactone decarboxylase family protein [Streptomyces sp. QH1-20]|uniref:carboxymuconolactone decarboxylase family protein n=1 Tax=Streptomyces sp. QH1-20 TaxID=3240934 RepID=UPI003518B37E